MVFFCLLICFIVCLKNFYLRSSVFEIFLRSKSFWVQPRAINKIHRVMLKVTQTSRHCFGLSTMYVLIQFREVGLLIGQALHGHVSTNYSNSAQCFFIDPTPTSAITKFVRNLIHRFRVILQIQPCGKSINPDSRITPCNSLFI